MADHWYQHFIVESLVLPDKQLRCDADHASFPTADGCHLLDYEPISLNKNAVKVVCQPIKAQVNCPAWAKICQGQKEARSDRT